MYFAKFIPFILSNEGGYVNNPLDTGGETNFGISKRSYKDLDIKNLTSKDAEKIYYKDFYLPLNIETLRNEKMQMAILDFAIHSGAKQAIKTLQRVLNVYGGNLSVDGKIGPITLKTLKYITGRKGNELFKKYVDARLSFLKSLSDWKYFGKGWSYRINKILKYKSSNSAGVLLGLILVSTFSFKMFKQ